MDKPKRRVWLDINLKTLEENFRKIAETVSPCSVMAVLKANAYGLGVNGIAKTLSKAGAGAFGAAELNEALELRKTGKPVHILGGILEDEIPDAINAGIVIPVTSREIAELISRESVRQNKTAECHFLIDTGMGRLGILAENAVETIIGTVRLPNLDFSGIYSHFPMAYRQACEITEGQIEKFLNIINTLKSNGITFKKIHMANSDAVNNFPMTFHSPFNYVRTGINMYGAFDNEGRRILKINSILSLKTRLVSIRTLSAGMTVGYGCTCRLLRDTQIGTVCAGYADGLPLALSNRGSVIINGVLCPIMGRVSMDYTTVSLENAPDAQRGDEVTCLGGHSPTAITVEDWARTKGTHSYDIICSFGSRVQRRYIKG
jgi:alanine racemase